MRYRPVIMITGASSGIGLAIAKLLIKKDAYRLALAARESSLPRFKKHNINESENVLLIPLDIKVGDERHAAISKIKRHWDGVDILINNAGISYRAVVEHMDEVNELESLRTNYLAPMALIRLVLPYMRERGRGKIINISSVSGMLAMPTMSSYTASKHALEGASEALWYEMKPLGIDVTLVQPGFIKSDSFKNVYYSDESEEAEEGHAQLYADYYNSMSPFIAKMMNRSRTTPEKVAKIVYRVMRKRRPKLRVPATMDAVLFYYLRRLIPRSIFHHFLFRMLPNSSRWGRDYTNKRPPKKLFQSFRNQ